MAKTYLQLLAKYKISLAVLGFILVIGACTSDKKIDQKAVKEEIESREIKKITEAEIIAKVEELGNLVAANAKKTLGSNLQKAIKSGGLEHAISFCNIKAIVLTDSLSRQYSAEIRRISLKPRNSQNIPNEIEKQILDAYEHQWKDSIPLQTNVQPIEEKRYLFSKPIMIDNGLCLNCHGNHQNGLLEQTRDMIQKKYPNDKATGYRMGDLRGMWSISFPKKQVVQSL